MRHSYLLMFTIETDTMQRDEPPDIEEFAAGIWDGLPKEWQDASYEGYALTGIAEMGEISR